MKLALTATPSEARFAPILLRSSASEAFSLAAELGFDGVELHLRHPDDVDRDEVSALIRTTGLEVPTIGTGMAAGEDGLTFADPDPAVRRAAVERILAQIRLAAQWSSAVTIGFLWGRVGRVGAGRLANLGVALACLETCCGLADNLGVTLLFEPLNRYESDYPNTLAEACDIIEQVDSPSLKLLADTYHMNIEESDIAGALRLAGPRLGHVHLVDSNRQAPGHGHLDVRSVLAALRGMGYTGYLSFECLPLPEGRVAALDAARLVRGLLAEEG